MTRDSGKRLKTRLRGFGISNSAISAAWPRWWSDEADASPSAQAELRFSVARRLGLDPRSLLDDGDEPRFLWREEARFKHLSGESDVERAGITSFGRAVAAVVVAASPTPTVTIAGARSLDLRRQILRSGRPYVDLLDLLSLAWSSGVPVIHLRVFPWTHKRMAAMTVRLGDQWAVLLGKDSGYPAPIAFYIAHELGHIALNHLAVDRLIVDFEEVRPTTQTEDAEEKAADEFALELLTGDLRPTVLPEVPGRRSAIELARRAMGSAAALEIEPGMLAQAFGYSTGDWATATAAMRHIYGRAVPIWTVVNGVAGNQLDLDGLTEDATDFLEVVLGQLST